jgi:hypothetical protein
MAMTTSTAASIRRPSISAISSSSVEGGSSSSSSTWQGCSRDRTSSVIAANSLPSDISEDHSGVIPLPRIPGPRRFIASLMLRNTSAITSL